MRGYTTTKGSPDCTSAHYECPGSWTKGQDMSLPTEGGAKEGPSNDNSRIVCAGEISALVVHYTSLLLLVSIGQLQHGH